MGLPFELVLPYEGFGENWPQEGVDYLNFLCEKADRVVTVCSGGWQSSRDNWKYGKRDEHLVDHSTLVVALFDGDTSRPSGTLLTIQYAQKKSVEVRNVWAAWQDHLSTRTRPHPQ